MASTNLIIIIFFQLGFLVWTNIVLCLAQSQVSLPIYGLPIPNPNSVDALESKSIASLEKAQQLLQRSLALLHGSFGNCRAQLNTALGSIRWVETLLLEGHYRKASDQLLAAQKTISDCNGILSSSPVQLAQAVLYLSKQALNHVEAAATSVTLLESQKSGPVTTPAVAHPESAGGNENGDCLVDGTKCQFSFCAQGKGLPNCAVGFATGVTGGSKGQNYVVTGPQDDPQNPQPGRLRYGVNLAAQDARGVWITFAKDTLIVLKDMLWVKSSTTIDGRGVNVTITGRNVVLGGVHNVILINLQINSLDGSDTVNIFAGSSKVWVDHLTSFNAKLGLVSVLQGSTDVTISNCLLSNPNFNMLLGASDADMEDQAMRVTVYRNWFKDSMQRMPHCRWGYCHVINNLYTNWGYYAVGARVHAKVLAESNVFIASRKTEITPWFAGAGSDFDMTATIQSKNNLLLNGSTFHEFLQFGPASAPQYTAPQSSPVIHTTNTLANLVTNCAGALVSQPKLQQCMSQQ